MIHVPVYIVGLSGMHQLKNFFVKAEAEDSLLPMNELTLEKSCEAALTAHEKHFVVRMLKCICIACS